MPTPLRPRFAAFAEFVRTPTLGRSITALLAVGLTLLLAANLLTFVMIRRTIDFNDRVEQSQAIRRAARTVLISLLNAETGQRGYLLTTRSEFLGPYDRATADLPQQLAELHRLSRGDPELEPIVDDVMSNAVVRASELQRNLDLKRMGRLDDALAQVRTGHGKAIMDRMRAEIDTIEEIETERLRFRTQQSEQGQLLTIWANAIAALLILALGVVVVFLIRRYVGEIQQARNALDRLNAGLENEVRDRTAALTRANEEIQRFAYIVSHDLRAPLVNVMGYTSELEQAGRIVDKAIVKAEQERHVDPEVVTAIREDMPEAIGFIRASTEKMDRLINAILKLSREGRRNPAPESLDMTLMVQKIADSVRHQVEAQGAEIVVEPLPLIDSDRLSIEQVFGNLIDNAVKYLDPVRPGRIVVSGVDGGDGWTTYRIADNGRGISERDHERIFELFRRSGRQDRPGEGLGLAFVRNSVRRLGGEIAVESELGKGSTFVLKFPTRLIPVEGGETA